MKSEAVDVEGYLAEVPGERREAMAELRRLCLAHLAGYEEYIDYGMPCYCRDGKMEVSFASQKQFIALYVMKAAVVEAFRERLKVSIGKGCIRFTRAEKMDFAVIAELLEAVVKSSEEPC